MKKLFFALLMGGFFFTSCEDRDKAPDPDPDVREEVKITLNYLYTGNNPQTKYKV